MAKYLAVTGDEVGILTIARRFVLTGHAEAVPMGTQRHMPGGGGALVHAAFGAPLLLADSMWVARALSALVVAVSALTMARIVAKEVSRRFAFWFVAVYWIGPWTVYHGALVWEPALMFLPAAVHFAACLCLRRHGTLAASAALFWAMVAAFQIHPSFLVLVVAAAALLLQRRIRIDIRGAALGLVAGSVTLWPAVSGIPVHPVSTVLRPDGYFGWGLVHVYPVLKALGLWVRMSSSEMNRQLRYNTLYAGGATTSHAWQSVLHGMTWVVIVLSAATVLASAAASWWFLRPRAARSGPDSTQWLRGYALAVLLGLLLASATSPVSLSAWHAIVALPAACIPFAAWLEDRWAGGGPAQRLGIASLFAMRVVVVAMIALGCQFGAVAR